eukprot:TRINITY_DN70515_c0_g1_i1.p1 TRINITY_DN70515_c0_g1~~TRINITY_DN70515_c0_g1_i1.p1  ORF type:complete len:385 (+),score=146.64 TRINITY_DN70515_c0_g1_i1:76-1230(+)
MTGDDSPAPAPVPVAEGEGGGNSPQEAQEGAGRKRAATGGAPAAKRGSAKERKVAREKGEPQPPPHPRDLYFETRQQRLAELITIKFDCTADEVPQQLLRVASAREWDFLPRSEKAPFEERAKQLEEDYGRELEAWKAAKAEEDRKKEEEEEYAKQQEEAGGGGDAAEGSPAGSDAPAQSPKEVSEAGTPDGSSKGAADAEGPAEVKFDDQDGDTLHFHLSEGRMLFSLNGANTVPVRSLVTAKGLRINCNGGLEQRDGEEVCEGALDFCAPGPFLRGKAHKAPSETHARLAALCRQGKVPHSLGKGEMQWAPDECWAEKTEGKWLKCKVLSQKKDGSYSVQWINDSGKAGQRATLEIDQLFSSAPTYPPARASTKGRSGRKSK